MSTEIGLTLLLGFALVAALVAVEARDLLASAIATGAVALAAAMAFVVLGAPDLALVQLAGVVVILVVLIRGSAARERGEDGESSGFPRAVGLAVASVLLVICSAVYMAGENSGGLPRFGRPVSLEPYDAPGGTPVPPGRRKEAEARPRASERGVSRLYLDESWRALQAAENRRINNMRVRDAKYQPRDESFKPRGGQLHFANRVTAVLLDYRALDALAAAAAVLAGVLGVTLVLRAKRGAATKEKG